MGLCFPLAVENEAHHRWYDEEVVQHRLHSQGESGEVSSQRRIIWQRKTPFSLFSWTDCALRKWKAKFTWYSLSSCGHMGSAQIVTGLDIRHILCSLRCCSIDLPVLPLTPGPTWQRCLPLSVCAHKRFPRVLLETNVLLVSLCLKQSEWKCPRGLGSHRTVLPLWAPPPPQGKAAVGGNVSLESEWIAPPTTDLSRWLFVSACDRTIPKQELLQHRPRHQWRRQSQSWFYHRARNGYVRVLCYFHEVLLVRNELAFEHFFQCDVFCERYQDWIDVFSLRSITLLSLNFNGNISLSFSSFWSYCQCEIDNSQESASWGRTGNKF